MRVFCLGLVSTQNIVKNILQKKTRVGNNPLLQTQVPVAMLDATGLPEPASAYVNQIQKYSLEPINADNSSRTTNWYTSNYPIPDTNLEFAYSVYITTTNNYLDGYIYQNLETILSSNIAIKLPEHFNNPQS